MGFNLLNYPQPNLYKTIEYLNKIPLPSMIEINRFLLSSSFCSEDNVEESNIIQFYQYLRGETEECPYEYSGLYSTILHNFNKDLCEMLHFQNKLNIGEISNLTEENKALNQLINDFPDLEFLNSTIIPPYLNQELIDLGQILTLLYFNNQPNQHWNLCNPILNFGTEIMYSNEGTFKYRTNAVKEHPFDIKVLYSFIKNMPEDSKQNIICEQIKYLLGYPLQNKDKIEYYIKLNYEPNFPKRFLQIFNITREQNINFREALLENDTFKQETSIHIIKLQVPYLRYLFKSTLSEEMLSSLIIPKYGVKKQVFMRPINLVSIAHDANLSKYCYWNCFHPIYNYALDAMFSSDSNLKLRAVYANSFGQTIKSDKTQ